MANQAESHSLNQIVHDPKFLMIRDQRLDTPKSNAKF